MRTTFSDTVLVILKNCKNIFYKKSIKLFFFMSSKNGNMDMIKKSRAFSGYLFGIKL
jgi:hypothetical protein